ncbi:hypothetical protein BSL78_24597 [Apostichopus japonicus]|uniref:Uncharacterized protein n=1 Tax=Stichopus japonicus TaxID=307972 RepID=A0A2G8JS72_STIJA|nr:hypothetical protein BSL78_24597 [Apostichopus japonicus]
MICFSGSNHNWLREGEQTPDDLHNRVQEEKLMRQSMLAKTRALAEEVKEQSLLRGRVGNQDMNHQNSYMDQSYHWSSEEER